MKKVFLPLVCGLIVIGVGTQAFAIPKFKKAFDDKYATTPELRKVSDELKCFLCHGKAKTVRNDYGKALSEFLKKGNYSDDRFKAEGEKVKMEFEDAFKKVEAMKATDGKTFGERLKAGKAPGTPVTE